MLYFSYGSFMNTKNLKRHCPSAIVVGRADLLNYEVQFNFMSHDYQCGVTGAEFAPGKITHGVLFEVSETDMQHLDLIEEVPEENYYRETVLVVDAQGQYQRADLYRTSHPQGPYRTSQAYLQHMLQGAQEHDLPAAYIAELQHLYDSLDS